MSSKREVPGLADMIATVISPLLIMIMISSLIFFLIEVIYNGDYSDRLRWTFGFYVFGAVLVARIAIEMGSARASAYAIALGAAALVATMRFVEYPQDSAVAQFAWLVNILLLVLVWWCARKLTWDCTHIDDEKDGSDRSLLEATGLDALERPAEWREPDGPVSKQDKESKRSKASGLDGWLARYRQFRKDRDARPHTPGTWVVFFSLAALPIFGLGQSLIPPEEEQSRNFTFWLMAAYVGSGLGLLMTTSFLGLRRYLKERKLQIPAKMAGVWLGVGSGLILLFLAIAAVLPRPNSETPLVNISGIGSRERDASNFAVNPSGQGKGDGSAGEKSDENSKSNSSTEGKSKEAGQGKGQDDGSKGNGEKNGKNGNAGENQKSNDPSQQQGGDKGKNGEEKKQDGPNKTPDQQGKSSGSSKATSGSARQGKQGARTASSKSPPSIPALGKLASALKWIVFVILALAVAFFFFRHGLKFLANFTLWAKQLLDFLNNFWARLFGTSPGESASEETSEEIDVPVSRPFSDFANPFESGSAERQTPSELIKYSFAALEAFGREHEFDRGLHETPIEFAARAARLHPEMAQSAPRLANLYARLAYARGSLPSASRDQIREFWKQLELAHEEALHLRHEMASSSR